MKYIPLLLLIGCSPPEINCNDNCGKLISKHHFRSEQTILLTYVTNCNDTLTSEIKLNEQQLSNDNGIAYFIEAFKLKQKYCDESKN